MMREAAIDEEEEFMDHILEDVGMVFGNSILCVLPGMMDPLFSLDELDEQCYLEQQLRELGINLGVNIDDIMSPGSPGFSRGPGAMSPTGFGGVLHRGTDEVDDDLALLSFRSHGQGKNGKAGPASDMQTRS